jgi:hypothetical protein
MITADFWGEAVPNWIGAVVGVLTLGAAIAAGVFAARAAHWTKKQAESSEDQAETAAKALSVAEVDAAAARVDAEFQRSEAARVSRRAEETRLDALVPSIFAGAELGSPAYNGPTAIDFHRWVNGDYTSWEPLKADVEIEQNDMVIFRMTVILTFENLSDVPARIDVVEPDNGDITDLASGTPLASGMPLFVPAKATRAVEWTRTVSSTALADEAAVARPENSLFRLSFWVRDIGMNVLDVYRFSGNMNHFSRNGTRLVASPEPSGPWPDAVAAPVERRYERLS